MPGDNNSETRLSRGHVPNHVHPRYVGSHQLYLPVWYEWNLDDHVAASGGARVHAGNRDLHLRANEGDNHRCNDRCGHLLHNQCVVASLLVD